jgi:hypothetical protein
MVRLVTVRWRRSSMTAPGGVAVESAAAESGPGGDGGEGDGLAFLVELGAGTFDAVEDARVGHHARTS